MIFISSALRMILVVYTELGVAFDIYFIFFLILIWIYLQVFCMVCAHSQMKVSIFYLT